MVQHRTAPNQADAVGHCLRRDFSRAQAMPQQYRPSFGKQSSLGGCCGGVAYPPPSSSAIGTDATCAEQPAACSGDFVRNLTTYLAMNLIHAGRVSHIPPSGLIPGSATTDFTLLPLACVQNGCRFINIARISIIFGWEEPHRADTAGHCLRSGSAQTMPSSISEF